MRLARLFLGLVAALAAACAHRPLHLDARLGAEVESVGPRRYRLHLDAPEQVPWETALAIAGDISLSAGFRYFRLIDEATPTGTRIIEHPKTYTGAPGLRSYQLGRTTLFECLSDGTSFRDTFAARDVLRRFTLRQNVTPLPQPTPTPSPRG